MIKIGQVIPATTPGRGKLMGVSSRTFADPALVELFGCVSTLRSP